MPRGFIEHANLTVTDPDRSSDLFQKLCGWHERWRGRSPDRKNQNLCIHLEWLVAVHSARQTPRRAVSFTQCTDFIDEWYRRNRLISAGERRLQVTA